MSSVASSAGLAVQNANWQSFGGGEVEKVGTTWAPVSGDDGAGAWATATAETIVERVVSRKNIIGRLDD